MPNVAPNSLDAKVAQEFEETLNLTLDSVPVLVFLCGKALPVRKVRNRKSLAHSDLRLYLQGMLKKEFKSCHVQFGEHRHWMKIYGKVAGKVAFNLADHEIAVASKIDLLVIFPCSPGSFAELGMFSVEPRIAEKMVIFLDAKFRKSKGYVVDGPIAAAKRRKSTIFVVRYSDRKKIWAKIKDIVLKIRANKGKTQLLA